jgi:hypothetical protein
MKSSVKPIALGASIAVAAALLTGPAEASQSLPTLVLSLKFEDALLGNSVTLGCDEDDASGSHPRRTAACAAIQTANGDFDRLRPTGQNCTMIYNPIVARAVGRWHGRQVTFEHTFGNPCAAASQSADVFRF